MRYVVILSVTLLVMFKVMLGDKEVVSEDECRAVNYDNGVLMMCPESDLFFPYNPTSDEDQVIECLSGRVSPSNPHEYECIQ